MNALIKKDKKDVSQDLVVTAVKIPYFNYFGIFLKPLSCEICINKGPLYIEYWSE